MSRTITVKGIGRASAKPDYVVLSMTLEAKHKEYQAAMDMAGNLIQHLNDTITAIGFEKGAAKTTNFNVRTDYERVKNRYGNYESVFCGYEVTRDLTLRLISLIFLGNHASIISMLTTFLIWFVKPSLISLHRLISPKKYVTGVLLIEVG